MMHRVKSLISVRTTRPPRDLRFFIDAPMNGFLHPIGAPVEMTGWCFFDQEPVYLIEVRLDNKLLLVNRLNHSRPDVLADYPQAREFGEPVGFQYAVDLPKDLKPGNHILHFFALNNKNKRESIKVIEFEAVDPSSQRSFSQRFAEIPPHLVRKVNASISESDFLRIGSIISNVVEENVGDPSLASKILDFGCGLGRVLLPMLQKAPRAAFTGFDIDPMMLLWCSHLLEDVRCRFVFTTLELPDGEYDIIYAVSVFTHLDITTDYWLAEIHRLLAPKGRAFITYHDETLFEEIAGSSLIPDVPKGTKLCDRHVVGKGTPEGGAAVGTFYATEYWRQILDRYFSVDHMVPRGLFGHQSFAIVTPKNVRIDRTVIDRQYIHSLEQQLFELRNACRVMY